MRRRAEINTLVATAGAKIWAIDPQGSQIVPIPGDLPIGSAQVVELADPLALVAPDSRGLAVGAYEGARRQGHGSAPVTIVGEDRMYRVHIFDLAATHGCLIAIATPGDAAQPASSAGQLTPRQASYRLSATGVFLSISPELTGMLGWPEVDLVGRSALDFIHPDDHEDGIVAWIELLENPSQQCRIRQRFRRLDGDWLWCEVTDSNHLDNADSPHVFSELVDVSRELAALDALQRRETLFVRLTRSLPTGVLHLGPAGEVEVCNDRWVSLSGCRPGDGLAELIAAVVESEEVQAAARSATEAGLDTDVDVTFRRESAACRFGKLHFRPLSEGAELSGLLVTLDDVTNLRTYQHELAEQARRDPLTGIYNRLGIEDTVARALSERRSTDTEVAVLFLDLDRFKAINDGHGHAVGDRVLQLVAHAIGSLLRPEDMLGRLGGDEFLVMLRADDGNRRAAAVVNRIIETVSNVGHRLDEPVDVGVTVGVAIAVEGDDFDALLRRADAAMYAGKPDRRGVGFTPGAGPFRRVDQEQPQS